MSDKKPKTIDASCPVSFMGCEGEVIVEMTPTEAVLMIEKAWQENKRLRQENASLTAERDEGVVDIERLRKERDDARRRLCVELLEVEGLPVGWKGKRGAAGVAERMGWDCFKENT